MRRAIIAYGKQSEEKLFALCAPASVIDETGSSAMIRKTFVRWRQLGFFREVDGRIEIAPGFMSIPADDLDALRHAVLRLALLPMNNPGLGADGQDASSDELSLATDFTKAAAWVLAQDPYSFPTSWTNVDQLQNQQSANPRPFSNDTRWHGFVQWGAFLGVVWPSPSGYGVVPNPAFAVRKVLEEVFRGVEEAPQDTFFSRLAEALPVIDGGVYRRTVDASVSGVAGGPRAHQVSASLSLALLHLEAAGDIRIEARADAPQRILLGRRGRELRRVSHVVYLVGS